MSQITSFRDLDAWKAGMDVVESTYRVTATFPSSEQYGLAAQMRRSAVSVPSNVAEGQAVRAPRWTLRHIVIAIGSSCELDTQLEVALRLRYVSSEAARDLLQKLDRLQKLLYGMRRERERRLGTVFGGLALLIAVTTALP